MEIGELPLASRGTDVRSRRTEDRGQKLEDKGKKVRGWEGPKVRRKPQSDIGILITFGLSPLSFCLST
jgi:hypothetical protein